MKASFFRYLFCTTLAFFTARCVNAQSFNSETHQANLALGIGNRFIGFPPIMVGYEKYMKDVYSGKIGGVGVLGITSGSRNAIVGPWVNYNTFLLGVKGNYYWDQLNTDKYNVYGGLGVGLILDNNSAIGTSSNLYLMLGIGGRYYITDKIALFSEIGNNLSSLSIGATIKLK